jgi:DHA2 family multidrug resistance protein
MQSGLALMPRTLVMMVAVPIVGRLYGKVSARLLIAIGLALVAAGAIWISFITLQTTTSGITHPIMLQGVGFAFLFVPLTTAALSEIPRAKLADATGLNSLLRQVGASMGLAVFASLLSRYAVHAKASIAAHVALDRPEVQERLAALVGGFQARGFDAVSAREMALRALDGTVMRQAMVISFERVFFLSGLCLLCVIPLLYFLKVKRRPASKPQHVELEM